MKIIKNTIRQNAKVSIILLDWSVRESFHFLHYIKNQTVGRETFEVIIVEFYSRVSEEINKFQDQVDKWILLEMPSNCYYHKHLMYNVGLAFASGEIIVICDSDAMVKPTFLNSIVSTFEKNDNIFLHLDQFRNNRKDFYPFCYPSFEEVEGYGCDNAFYGKTKGLHISRDILHNRNYGSCFCAKRDDLISIGGSDEHVDYVGHVCGPYDMTFRLINAGKREVWHEHEFLYHTWHPGQSGDNNYYGPHDGKEMSSTSITTMMTGQVMPHVVNSCISKLRSNLEQAPLLTEDQLIAPQIKNYSLEFLTGSNFKYWAEKQYLIIPYGSYYIFKKPDGYYAVLAIDVLKVSKIPYLEKIPSDLYKCNSEHLDVLKENLNHIHNKGYILATRYIEYVSVFKVFIKLSLEVTIRVYKKFKMLLMAVKKRFISYFTRIMNIKNKLFMKLHNRFRIESSVKQLNLFSIGSLVSNLSFHKDKKNVVFLTTQISEYQAIESMKKLFVFRNIRVVFVKDNYADVSAVIKEIFESNVQVTLFVNHNFYIMYLYLFNKLYLNKNLCVL